MFDLKSDATVNYSPAERDVFRLLGQQPKDSRTIANELYGSKTAPFHSRQLVIGALRSLGKKAKRNKEPFKISNSKRSGPIPMTFWIEDKRK